MTALELLEYIGAADDKYIMESRRRPKKRRKTWPLALAACAAVALLGGSGLWLSSQGKNAALSAEAPAALENTAETADAEEAPAAAPAEPEMPEKDFAAYDVALLAQAEYPKAISEEDYDALSDQWVENQTSDDTKYAINSFAYSTAAKVLQDSTDSGCYSPLSLYQALSILAGGAEGQTRDEILSLLGQSDIDTLAEQAGKLYRVNYFDHALSTVKIANSLWLDETAKDGTPIEYKQDWVLSAAANYYADVYQAEFSGPETAEALGAWIAEKTGGFLRPTPEDLKLSDETVMAIVNTLWYKDQWTAQFDRKKTEPADFQTEDGETISWDFMHCTKDMGGYVKGEGYTKSMLGLSQGTMYFVLPDEGVDVDSLLTEEKLWEIFENGDYEQADVIWSVPKFETDVTYELKEMLESLGVSAAFTEYADFSPISDTPLYLGQVQQGTHIAVNEDGVEAAAYSILGVAAGAAMPEEMPTVEMNLNRPFLYLITARDGSPLFMGVVRNPSK